MQKTEAYGRFKVSKLERVFEIALQKGLYMSNIEENEPKGKKSDFFSEIFKQRLIEARTKMNLGKNQVVKRLKEMGIPVSLSSYCRWEQGTRLPKDEKLEALAKALNVSKDWLCGRTDIREPTVKEEVNGKDLRKEDLYLRRGEPVWIQNMKGCWGIISLTEDVVYLPNGNKLPFYQVQEPISHFPAPLCYGVESLKNPIPLNRLKSYERIWVQGIGQAPMARFKGWFTYNKALNCFMGENRATVSLRDYAVTWIAYEDICD